MLCPRFCSFVAVIVLDRSGAVRSDSHAGHHAADLSATRLCAQHRNNILNALLIGAAPAELAYGAEVVLFSRRPDTADDEFDGVVMMAMAAPAAHPRSRSPIQPRPMVDRARRRLVSGAGGFGDGNARMLGLASVDGLSAGGAGGPVARQQAGPRNPISGERTAPIIGARYLS